MESKLDIELASLTDSELLELYGLIEEHRSFLEGSILEYVEEAVDNSSNDENKDSESKEGD